LLDFQHKKEGWIVNFEISRVRFLISPNDAILNNNFVDLGFKTFNSLQNNPFIFLKIFFAAISNAFNNEVVVSFFFSKIQYLNRHP